MSTISYNILNEVESLAERLCTIGTDDSEQLDCATLLAYKVTEVIRRYDIERLDAQSMVAINVVLDAAASAMVMRAMRILFVHFNTLEE